jgi:hypothetical protein
MRGCLFDLHLTVLGGVHVALEVGWAGTSVTCNLMGLCLSQVSGVCVLVGGGEPST